MPHAPSILLIAPTTIHPPSPTPQITLPVLPHPSIPPQSPIHPNIPHSSPLSSPFQNQTPNSKDSSTIVPTQPNFSHHFLHIVEPISPTSSIEHPPNPPSPPHMITRSQNGISNPQIIPSLLSSECVSGLIQPTSYTQPSRDPL
ncbi:hypothetical protein LIER_42304 [Lithospermum erythrorhizon]|uniref:Uncharacterized protein n=1 Tax=Lithospermum erythrorhizon TaxID=34254 RepID=A0AAV3RTB5_LITER